LPKLLTAKKNCLKNKIAYEVFLKKANSLCAKICLQNLHMEIQNSACTIELHIKFAHGKRKIGHKIEIAHRKKVAH
jgi:hypothetical protein